MPRSFSGTVYLINSAPFAAANSLSFVYSQSKPNSLRVRSVINTCIGTAPDSCNSIMTAMLVREESSSVEFFLCHHKWSTWRNRRVSRRWLKWYLLSFPHQSSLSYPHAMPVYSDAVWALWGGCERFSDPLIMLHPHATPEPTPITLDPFRALNRRKKVNWSLSRKKERQVHMRV